MPRKNAVQPTTAESRIMVPLGELNGVWVDERRRRKLQQLHVLSGDQVDLAQLIKIDKGKTHLPVLPAELLGLYEAATEYAKRHNLLA